MLKLAKAGGDLRVVSDQRGSPTYAGHLARTLAQLSRIKAYGIYHATGSGSCSWFEFAQAILKATGYDGVRVLPISTQESGRPARRPANSVLENRRLVQSGLGELPRWTDGLADYLAAAQQSGESAAWEPHPRSHTPGPEVTAR
jgi:dTDP-4-dehydrorhamnose reductase